MSPPPSDPPADGEEGTEAAAGSAPDALPPRDPKRVRFWGWVAVVAAVLIVLVGLVVGRPWRSCHCPLHRPAHSLVVPAQPVEPARLTAAGMAGTPRPAPR